MIDCGQDYKYPGLRAAHGSVFRGAVCEAVLIQRVRDVLEAYRVVSYREMSQTDALGAIRDALDDEHDQPTD